MANPAPVAQRHYAEDEPLYRRSLAIKEKALGPEHDSVATTLNNLAELLHSQVTSSAARRIYRKCRKGPVRDRAGHFWQDACSSIPAKRLFSITSIVKNTAN